MRWIKELAFAVAILVFAVGLGGVVWAMTRGEDDNMAGMSAAGEQNAMADGGAPFDQAFIDSMVPHHELAVEMARYELAHGQRPELKRLAQAIVDAQTAEIAKLRAWRTAWYGSDDTSESMPMEMPSADMSDLEGAANVDWAFIDAMIPHHESAVDMAQDARRRAEHPEIRALAEDVITAQQAEIAQLEEWREAWFVG